VLCLYEESVVVASPGDLSAYESPIEYHNIDRLGRSQVCASL
jgi:hypothetical protein